MKKCSVTELTNQILVLALRRSFVKELCKARIFLMNNKAIKITAIAIVTIVIIVSIGSLYLFSSSKTAIEAPADDLKSSTASNYEVSTTDEVVKEIVKNPAFTTTLKERETNNSAAKPEEVPIFLKTQ